MTQALRAIWPGFCPRNLAPDVRAYFTETFPIAAADREALARRYVLPIVAAPAGG